MPVPGASSYWETTPNPFKVSLLATKTQLSSARIAIADGFIPVATVAVLRGESLASVAEAATQNAVRLFGLDAAERRRD